MSTTEPIVPTITIPLVRGAATAKTIKATSDPALLWLNTAVLEAIDAAGFEHLTITIQATKFDGEVNELGISVSGLPEPEPTPEPEADAPEPDEPSEPDAADTPKAEPKRRTRAKAA
jgi:hypothetical protein